MNIKISAKTAITIVGTISLVTVVVLYHLFKPWQIYGTWVSGKNDGFGLMPVKKEFVAVFTADSYQFQGHLASVKEYQIDLENRLVVMGTGNKIIKIRIVDDNTIRFHSGRKGVGLRIYRRKE